MCFLRRREHMERVRNKGTATQRAATSNGLNRLKHAIRVFSSPETHIMYLLAARPEVPLAWLRSRRSSGTSAELF